MSGGPFEEWVDVDVDVVVAGGVFPAGLAFLLNILLNPAFIPDNLVPIVAPILAPNFPPTISPSSSCLLSLAGAAADLLLFSVMLGLLCLGCCPLGVLFFGALVLGVISSHGSILQL